MVAENPASSMDHEAPEASVNTKSTWEFVLETAAALLLSNVTSARGGSFAATPLLARGPKFELPFRKLVPKSSFGLDADAPRPSEFA